MKIEFLGPLGRVTGSCTWMHDEVHDWNFLVDCGIQQGEGDPEVWNQGINWPFKPSDIKFVLLTHAHMDHCGLIPLLYKEGFNGKVICTEETASIARVMLADAVKLGAFYDRDDVDKIRWFEPRGKSLLGGCLYPVDQDLFINFYRTSHIIGGVAIGVYWGSFEAGEQKKIIFSGDLGGCLEDKESLPLLRHRMQPHEFDYAVIESTYGGKVRAPEEQTAEFRRKQLLEVCDHVTAHKSSALMPSFSLGRIQDLLFDMHWVINSNPAWYSHIELVLDSPTANKLKPIILKALERTEVTGQGFKKVRPLWLGKQIFRWFDLDDTDPAQVDRAIDIIRLCFGEESRHPELAHQYGNELAKSWKSRVTVVSNREKPRLANSNRPRIILASSGSCDGGAVTHWLPGIVSKEKNILSFTGFTAPGSVAARLAAIKDLENSERRRHRGALDIGRANTSVLYQDIRCRITSLQGYSGHADQVGLLNWLFWTFKGKAKMAAPSIFIQHGNDNERSALRGAIHAEAATRPVSVRLPSQSNYQFDL